MCLETWGKGFFLLSLVVGTLVVWEELRPPEILREIACKK